MGNTVFRGPDSILAQIFELVTRPVAETMAMFNAIMDVGLFFLRGTKAHGYDIGPATVPAAAIASSTARLAVAEVSAYLRQVVTRGMSWTLWIAPSCFGCHAVKRGSPQMGAEETRLH